MCVIRGGSRWSSVGGVGAGGVGRVMLLVWKRKRG